MKKNIFLAFVLITGLECLGQPVQPYDENGYSIEKVKKFSVENNSLSASWRKEALGILNAELQKAGETLVLNEKHMFWILDHVQYHRVKIEKFSNSKNVGEKIQFFPDTNFDGIVGIFEYGKCKVILFKTICLNLIKDAEGITFFSGDIIPQEDPIAEEKVVSGAKEPTVKDSSSATTIVYVYCNDCDEQEQEGYAYGPSRRVEYDHARDWYNHSSYGYGGGCNYGGWGVNVMYSSYPYSQYPRPYVSYPNPQWYGNHPIQYPRYTPPSPPGGGPAPAPGNGGPGGAPGNGGRR